MADADKSDEFPLRSLIRELLQPGEKLYALADGARDRELAAAALGYHGLASYSLFQGAIAPELEDVAPRLIPLNVESGYLERWAQRLGTSAGILLFAPKEAGPLREHLRSTFVVTDEDGIEYFFRYFDPRVLRPFFNACSPDEAADFFGPVRRILVEAEDAGKLLSCTPAPGGVESEERELPG